MNKKKIADNYYTFLLLGLFAVLLLIFTATKGEMLWKLSTWKSMSVQLPEYGVLTLGVMLCFVIGCIDVSFVALADFAAIIACKYMIQYAENNGADSVTGWVIITAILIAMAVGAVGGYLNGNLISRLGIPPILATLSTQMVFRGLAIAFTKGYAVTGLPLLYTEIGHEMLFGFLPVSLLIFFIIFAIVGFILNFTTFGKKLYMIGSNPKAAKFSAINTTKMYNKAFVINGMIVAIGGMLMVNTMNSAKADFGSSYLMRSILILVLAGVLPDGGMGKIKNVLIAVISIQVISTSVNMFANLNSYYGSLIWGSLLLVMLMATSKLLGTEGFKFKRQKKKVQQKS